MPPSPIFPSRWAEIALIATSLSVLATCLLYAFIGLELPRRTFSLDPATWTVTSEDARCVEGAKAARGTDPANCLQRGDRILEIDGISYDTWLNDRSAAIFTGERQASLWIDRDGERRRVLLDWRREPTTRTVEGLISNAFPLLFWLLGTVTAVLVRPRDERWLVLLAFYYIMALFLAAGPVSFSNRAAAFTVSRVCLALFLPLVVHLHLVLPRRDFPLLYRTLLPALWAIGIGLAIFDLVVGYPSWITPLLFLAGLFLSLGVFFVRLFRPAPPAVRTARRIILAGLLIGLLPTTIVALVSTSLGPVTSLPFDTDKLLITALAAVLLPNWPLAYLYAIYKLDLGKIELRANRALGGYSFWSLYITLYVTLFLTLAARWPLLRDEPVLTSLGLSLLFVSTTPYWRRIFQRWIDRHVFGLHHTPEEIVDLFASRIPTALEDDALGCILEKDILPTLLVRESALVLVGADGRSLEPFHLLGVTEEDLPGDVNGLEGLFLTATEGRPGVIPESSLDPPLDWVRVVLPLASQDRELGGWLLGRRDPDDHYPRDDVRLLSNLANQVTSLLRVRRELAENRRLQDQLLQSQKMEAIGRLSAGVAHDFNNLLSAILGYSDLLLDAEPPSEQGRERQSYARGIREAGEKAAALTGQLLAFSRQQVMAARVVDLNRVVAEIESLLRRLLDDDIELVTVLDAELPRVRIDPGQMEQVLLNLAVNASDAMTGRGGTLTLTTLEVVCGGASSPCPPEVAPGPWVVLRVADTGTGIADDVVDRIFEPFFTTKTLGEGTGLGLSMVYGIITQSQGHIAVDTRPGEGTTFSIFLPLAADDPGEAPLDDTDSGIDLRVDLPPRTVETVLLVEDEQSVRRVVFEMLRTKGFEVIQAENGADALTVAAAHDGPIDLLLTDVMMPHLKGPELAERLLAERPGMGVIFMSGYNEEMVLGERLARGDGVLLRKPFKPKELVREVRACLDRRARAAGEPRQ